MVGVVVASCDDTKVLALMQPRFTHDCDECTFLGYADWPSHVELCRADLWVHDEGEESSLILRTGHDGPEYHSFSVRIARVVVEQRGAAEWQLALALYDAWRNSADVNVPHAEWRGIALAQA